MIEPDYDDRDVTHELIETEFSKGSRLFSRFNEREYEEVFSVGLFWFYHVNGTGVETF